MYTRKRGRYEKREICRERPGAKKKGAQSIHSRERSKEGRRTSTLKERCKKKRVYIVYIQERKGEGTEAGENMWGRSEG